MATSSPCGGQLLPVSSIARHFLAFTLFSPRNDFILGYWTENVTLNSYCFFVASSPPCT